MQLYQIQFKFILKIKDHTILIFVKNMISIRILIIIFLSLKKIDDGGFVQICIFKLNPLSIRK